MLHFMHTRVKIAGTQRIASSDGKPMMYLANHRSWADFFIDVYILGGRTLIMSRSACALCDGSGQHKHLLAGRHWDTRCPCLTCVRVFTEWRCCLPFRCSWRA